MTNCSVYRLVTDDGFVEDISHLEPAEYHSQLPFESKPIFIYTKIPVATGSSKLVKCLERLGFHLVDTNIVFRKPILRNPKCFYNNCQMRFAEQEDREQVAELARNNFIYSRFHLDDEIPSSTANNIKAEWASNFFAGRRGDKLVIALIDNVVVGFLLLLESLEDLIIDLIAVDKNQHRKGIASDMITYVEHHLNEFFRIQVGTQLANVPSIRLYEKMGFRVFASNYVFHYHKSY